MRALLNVFRLEAEPEASMKFSRRMAVGCYELCHHGHGVCS
jgi:hypothetical protein